MSLFVPNDGILNTYVTWDDLQESVFEAFGKDAKLGPKKAVKDAGKKNGVYSKICLITPDWSGDAHGLPETFAVKICSLLTLAESKADMGDLGAFASEEFVNSMEGYLKTIHNTEVRLYKVLKQHGTDIPLPKVYFSQEFTEENPLKGYIIMDYINDGETFHIIDNLTPELLLEPLKALAKLEAVSLKFNVEEHALFANNPTIAAFSQFFSKEAIGGMVTMLHALAGEKLADTVDTLERIGGELFDPALLESLPEKLGMKRVLCHGDFWSGNLIWKQGAGALELAAVVDLQMAHYGSPSTDMVRLLCSSLSGKDRRENWESLLEKFYSFLQKEIDGEEMPYTIDMLKRDYRSYFPLGAIMHVMVIGMMFQRVNTDADIVDKAKAMGVLTEKLGAILEDVCEVHKYNKEHPIRLPN